jgi:hypothetical protein
MMRKLLSSWDSPRLRAWLPGVLLALVPLLFAPAALPGQSTVTLQGRVTTETGQALQGVQVAVRNEETGNQRGTITGANGGYTIVGLPPGNYQVSIQMLGYGTQSRDIRLLVGQRATLDFQLSQGAIEVEGVAVRAEREPTFEVQRTDVSTPVVQAEIANLPLNTRNTMNLAAIVPGIKTFAPTAGRSLPAAGSLPDLRFWNFYLDGVEWKSMFNGNLVGIPQTGSPIPQEAVREFRVHLNPYDAEYTRGASYIISAVTHRGTNETHGSGFFYFQNNDLTELDHFQEQRAAANPDFQRADYERQQLGFNLRGPVMRDKLFYSLSYELNNTTNAIEVVPGRPAFNPDIWSRQAGTFSAPTKNHTGVARLTAPVGEQHTLDAIYAGRYYDSETFFGGTATRDAGINANYTVHHLQLRDQFTPTPALLNEVSFHLLRWNHNESPLVPGPELIYPSLRLTGRSGFPLELKETHLRLIDKLTYSVPGGRHLINGGVELSRIRTDSYLPNNQNGSFEFRTDTSSLPFRANVAVGFFNPGSTEDARAVTDGWITGLYVQDQWQATNNLTLNLGVRYDAEINTLNNDFTVPWADHPVLRQRIPEFLNEGDRDNDLNNIAPRFSFSWDVFGNQQTFLRGGTGIMYDRVATFMAFFEKRSAGWRSYEFQDPGTLDPEVLRQRVLQGGGTATPPSINLMKDRMDTPMNYQFSVGVGHQLSNNLALNLDYIQQQARNLYVQFNVNPVIPGQGRALTSDFGNIIVYDDIGEAQFQALAGQLTYDRRTNETLPIRLNAAYTLGWYESQFDGLGGYTSASFLDMQPTTGDERHRLVLSGLGPLPYGFLLSGVAIFATPTPFGVTIGQDLNNSGLTNDDWPDGIRTLRPENEWDNMYRTVDLRLAKEVPFGVGRMSVSAEVFNVFNWTNWSGRFGTMRDRTGNPLANFGEPSGVYAPRQAQVGLRYQF